MRALIVHIGEGSTQILLASTRKADMDPRAMERGAKLFGDGEAEEEKGRLHDRMFAMHDQIIRNGADLSLGYLGRVDEELRTALLRQAAEAVSQFGGLADVRSVAIAASLLDAPDRPLDDPLVQDFQEQLETPLRVLKPADEALWMLRGARGLYPGGLLACLAVGHWRTELAYEEPGRAPKLLQWEVGATRMPEPERLRGGAVFDSLPDLPRETPLLLSGEFGWRLGALRIGLCCHDLELLDETWLDETDFLRLDTMLRGLSVDERNLIPMIERSGDTLPASLLLTRSLLGRLRRQRVRVCSRGVAHGLASHLFYEGRR